MADWNVIVFGLANLVVGFLAGVAAQRKVRR